MNYCDKFWGKKNGIPHKIIGIIQLPLLCTCMVFITRASVPFKSTFNVLPEYVNLSSPSRAVGGSYIVRVSF